jgi:transposase-like protein
MSLPVCPRCHSINVGGVFNNPQKMLLRNPVPDYYHCRACKRNFPVEVKRPTRKEQKLRETCSWSPRKEKN